MNTLTNAGAWTIRLLFQSIFHFHGRTPALREDTQNIQAPSKRPTLCLWHLSDNQITISKHLLLFQLLKAMLPSLQTARYDLVLAATSRWVRVSYKTERLAKRFLNNAGKRAELSNRVCQRLEESENRTPGQDRRTATAPVVLSEHTPDPIRI